MSAQTLPPLPGAAHGIHEGKFKDRSPHIRSAGKLTATGDSTYLCMNPPSRTAIFVRTIDRSFDRPDEDGGLPSKIRQENIVFPNSPDIVKRFRASVRPDAGRSKIFYGRAADPEQLYTKEMVHGALTRPSGQAAMLLNPHPQTRFRMSLMDKKEDVYKSNQKAPLGRSHDIRKNIPDHLDPINFTFGIKTEIDGSAGELVNPNKNRMEVNEAHEQGRDLYRFTHADYHVGEQCNRKYSSNHYNKSTRFGIPTPHENDGRHVNQTLKWLCDERQERISPIVSKRVDDFCERTQPKLGQVHDPIKDTLKVPQDHTFGIMMKPDEYGVGDLLHGRAPTHYLRGKDQIRGVIAAVRQLLKKANYQNFNDLSSAFNWYDKDGSGKIDLGELRQACYQFSLPIEPELIEQVINFCDADGDGKINYTEFVSFLNWKDKFSQDIPTKDIDQVNLQSQIDQAIGQHNTSYGRINAVVGGVSTKGYRTYGVPTVRADLPAPRIKRVDDNKNYGDESDAYGLMNPHIYGNSGVYEKDFLIPRSKEEIYDVFKRIGVQMTLDTFDSFYDIAASRHPKGHVSIEAYRNVLDEAQASELHQKGIAFN